MEFKNGDIGFVISNDNPFSRIMAKVMGSKWSHTFYIKDSEHTIETEISLPFTKSVHEDTIACHTEDPNKSLEIWRPIDDSGAWMCKLRALSLLGKAYSYILMLILGIRCLFDRKFKNFYRHGWVCCTVVMYAYGLDEYSGDSEDFYQYVKNSGKFVKIFEK